MCTVYSSNTSVVLQQKQHVQRPNHGPTHPPCITVQQYVQQQNVKTFMRRSLLHLHVFTMPRGDGPLRRSPHVEALGCTAVLQQKQHVQQHQTHRPTHPRTHHVQQRSRDVQRQYVSSFMQTLCCCIVVGLPCFPMFLRSPAISETGDGSFRRSPLPARRIWRWRPFFRRRPRGLSCGAGVVRSRGRGRSRGARKSRSETGHSKTDPGVKIQSETKTTTFISVLVYNKGK